MIAQTARPALTLIDDLAAIARLEAALAARTLRAPRRTPAMARFLAWLAGR